MTTTNISNVNSPSQYIGTPMSQPSSMNNNPAGITINPFSTAANTAFLTATSAYNDPKSLLANLKGGQAKNAYNTYFTTSNYNLPSLEKEAIASHMADNDGQKANGNKAKNYAKSNDLKDAKKFANKAWKAITQDDSNAPNIYDMANQSKQLTISRKMQFDPFIRAQINHTKKQLDEALRAVKASYFETQFGLIIPQATTISKYEERDISQSQIAQRITGLLAQKKLKLQNDGRRIDPKWDARMTTLAQNISQPNMTFALKPQKPKKTRITNKVEWTNPNAGGNLDFNNVGLYEEAFNPDYALTKFARIKDAKGRLRKVPGFASREFIPYSGSKDDRYFIHYSNSQIKIGLRDELASILGNADLAKRIKIDPDVYYLLRQIGESMFDKLILAAVTGFVIQESGSTKPKAKITLDHLYNLFTSVNGQKLIKDLDLTNLKDAFLVSKDAANDRITEILEKNTAVSNLELTKKSGWVSTALKPRKQKPLLGSIITTPQDQENYLMGQYNKRKFDQIQKYDQATQQSKFYSPTVSEIATQMGERAWMKKVNKLGESLAKFEAKMNAMGITDDAIIKSVWQHQPTVAMYKNNMTYADALQDTSPVYDLNTLQSTQPVYEQLQNSFFPKKEKLGLKGAEKRYAPQFQAALKSMRYSVDNDLIYVNQAGAVLLAMSLNSNHFTQVMLNKATAEDINAVYSIMPTLWDDAAADYFGNDVIRSFNASVNKNPKVLTANMGNTDRNWVLRAVFVLCMIDVHQILTLYGKTGVEKLFPPTDSSSKNFNQKIYNLIEKAVELLTDNVDLQYDSNYAQVNYKLMNKLIDSAKQEFQLVLRTLLQSMEDRFRSIYGDTAAQIPSIYKELIVLLALDFNNPLRISSGGDLLELCKLVDHGVRYGLSVLQRGINNPHTPQSLEHAENLLGSATTMNQFSQFGSVPRGYIQTKAQKKAKKAASQQLAQTLQQIQSNTFNW